MSTPAAPRDIMRSTWSPTAFAVRKITGVEAVAGRERSAARVSRPSIVGIIMSSRMTSGVSSCAFRTPSTPLPASITSMPPTRLRLSRAIDRMSASSSMIRIFIALNQHRASEPRLDHAGQRPDSEPEGAAASFLALDADRAAMLLDDRLADGQPQAGASLLARVGRLDLTKLFENRAAVGHGHAAASVCDSEFDPTVPQPNGDRHQRTRRRELYGVREEIDDNLDDSIFVGPNRGRDLGRLDLGRRRSNRPGCRQS